MCQTKTERGRLLRFGEVKSRPGSRHPAFGQSGKIFRRDLLGRRKSKQAESSWKSPIEIFAAARHPCRKLNAAMGPGIPVNQRGTSQECGGCGRVLGAPKPLALLSAGANIAARDLQGRTPLHHVARSHRQWDVAYTLNLLLESRAKLAAVDDNGDTVMTLATRRRDAVAVRALVEVGVDGPTRVT